MNNKGQALVEFVLILPLFIFMMLVIIDMGRIFNEKNNLENDSMDIVELYKNGSDFAEISSIYSKNIINIDESNEEFYKFNISTSIDLMTPGLGKILGDPYLIEVERVVYHA